MNVAKSFSMAQSGATPIDILQQSKNQIDAIYIGGLIASKNAGDAQTGKMMFEGKAASINKQSHLQSQLKQAR